VNNHGPDPEAERLAMASLGNSDDRRSNNASHAFPLCSPAGGVPCGSLSVALLILSRP
jgi:hypothetical protein